MTAIIPKVQTPPFLLRSYRAMNPIRRWLDKRLTTFTDDWVGKFWEASNTPFNKFGLKIFTSFRCGHSLWLVNMESEIFHVTGKSRENEKPFSTIFIGDKGSLRYLVFSLYGSNEKTVVPMGRCFYWNGPKVAIELSGQADVIILEQSTGNRWKPDQGDWVFSPRRVRMVMDIGPGCDVGLIHSQLKARQHHNYQMVTKKGYFLEVSRKEEDFAYFYNRMFLPLIQNQHGDYANTGSLEYYQKMSETGSILFSCLPDRGRVAGTIVLPRNRVLYGIINGLLEGDKELRKNGALSSIYILTLEYAVKHHFSRIDIGEVAPLQTNGLYLHKNQWGFHAVESPWQTAEWLFWIPNQSQSALEWFFANPFLVDFAEWGGENLGKIY